MFSSIYNFIEKNPFKKFLALLLIGLPLLFFIDLGLGFILILISFIYGIVLSSPFLVSINLILFRSNETFSCLRSANSP